MSIWKSKTGTAVAITIGSVALLFLLFFASTSSPDESAILGSAVAEDTEQTLNKAARQFLDGKSDSGQFMAGWAHSNITPPIGAPTYGYSSRLGRGITGVADSVFVRALALSTTGGTPVVFLTADICTWVPGVFDTISAMLRRVIPGIFLYPGVTHTHNGPGGYANGLIDRLTMGGEDRELREVLITSSVNAATRAAAGLTPARYRALATEVPNLIMNRTGRPEPVDDGILLLEIRKSSGETSALVIFGAHATTLNSDALVCSGDYPGTLTRTLMRGGYSDVMFFSGATGQAGPALDGKTVSSVDIKAGIDYGELLAHHLNLLSNESAAPFVGDALIAKFAAPVSLPDYQYRLPHRILRHSVVGWLYGSDKPTADVRCVRIGKTLIMGHSFEFSGVIAKEIREEVNQADKSLWITGFNGRNYLYVVPDHYYEERMYETSMSLFGPTLGTYLRRITVQLARMMLAPEESRGKQFDLSQ